MITCYWRRKRQQTYNMTSKSSQLFHKPKSVTLVKFQLLGISFLDFHSLPWLREFLLSAFFFSRISLLSCQSSFTFYATYCKLFYIVAKNESFMFVWGLYRSDVWLSYKLTVGVTAFFNFPYFNRSQNCPKLQLQFFPTKYAQHCAMASYDLQS